VTVQAEVKPEHNPRLHPEKKYREKYRKENQSKADPLIADTLTIDIAET
jgi:hypothetical protein